MIFSGSASLGDFFFQHEELELLLHLVNVDSADYWLVGGCLRNLLLNLPQTDIDIACSVDPTPLAKQWAEKAGGSWFWLDRQRRQSRVLFPHGLIVDFNPLRAESIERDLELRDFTINSFALLLDTSFPKSQFIDPTSGLTDLAEKQLRACSVESFPDDPLRMLKGIRHAVTLEFNFNPQTWEQLCSLSALVGEVAGERVREEFAKILASNNVAAGIRLLDKSGVLKALFGPAGSEWNVESCVVPLEELRSQLNLLSVSDLSGVVASKQFDVSETLLFAQLLNDYSPENRLAVLHDNFRLSRRLQRIFIELETPPNFDFFVTARQIEDQRRQALLVETWEPFSVIKMLYWGVCRQQLSVALFSDLVDSFTTLQRSGRVPALLNGEQVADLLGKAVPKLIGQWQKRLKIAEIDGQIFSEVDAENWLKAKLSFDNKEA